MKGLKAGLALIGAIALSAQSSALASPTVSVPDFKNKAGRLSWWNDQVGKQLSDVLSNELSNAGVQVVERGNVDAVLSEQELADLGIVSKSARNNNTAKRGNMRGAQFIILGGVSAYDEGVEKKGSTSGNSFMGMGDTKTTGENKAYIAVDLRIVNSTTGEVVAARTIEGTATSTFEQKASKADLSAFGNLIQSGSNSRSAQMFGSVLGGIKSEKSSFEEKKAPKEKAIRAALISASDYVNCVLVVRGSCLAEFDAQERKRRSNTLNLLKFD